MDANKLKVLQNLDYTIKRVCGNCGFTSLVSGWGNCALHSYQHQKHTDSKRALSIHFSGSCGAHEWACHLNLQGFNEFKEE